MGFRGSHLRGMSSLGSCEYDEAFGDVSISGRCDDYNDFRNTFRSLGHHDQSRRMRCVPRPRFGAGVAAADREDLSLTLNVQNVLDENPPVYNNAGQNGSDPSYAFTLGRIFQLGFQKKF